MNTRSSLARALKAIRLARGLSQEDFSIVSSRTYISTLERGLKSPTIDKVVALADTLNVHPLTILALTFANADESSSDELFAKIADELMSMKLGK